MMVKNDIKRFVRFIDLKRDKINKFPWFVSNIKGVSINWWNCTFVTLEQSPDRLKDILPLEKNFEDLPDALHYAYFRFQMFLFRLNWTFRTR